MILCGSVSCPSLRQAVCFVQRSTWRVGLRLSVASRVRLAAIVIFSSYQAYTHCIMLMVHWQEKESGV